MRIMQAVMVALAFASGCAGGPDASSTSEPVVEPVEVEAAEHVPAPGNLLAHLEIEGMVCEACANAARECLEGVEGVQYVHVSFEDNGASVGYDPDQVTSAELAAALEAVDRGEAPAFQVSVLGEPAAGAEASP